MAFDAGQLASLRAIGEHRGRQTLYSRQAPEVLSSLRQVAQIESTESSNRIEGIVAPHARVEAIVLKTSNPANRPEQEIAGYRDALGLVHESARDIPFSVGVIRQLHQTVCRYLPEPGGNWKIADNSIVETHVDGTRRIRFQPTPAHLTPMQVEETVQRYRAAIETGHVDPLVLVPLAIFDFLCIHPFADGNGRLARLLSLLLLYHHGYDVGRYISLERVIEESKETYYEVLEESSRGWHDGAHDPIPWLNYFWGVLLRAYREFEDRVGNVRSGRGAKGARVRDAVERHAGPFSISDLEHDCPGVSRDMIRLVLRELKAEGIIAPTGKGRSAKWRRVDASKDRAR